MRFEIKVVTKSSRSELVQKDGMIKVYVRSAPEDGKANKEVIEIISEKFGVPKNAVSIITGQTSRKKIVEVLKNE